MTSHLCLQACSFVHVVTALELIWLCLPTVVQRSSDSVSKSYCVLNCEGFAATCLNLLGTGTFTFSLIYLGPVVFPVAQCILVPL